MSQYKHEHHFCMCIHKWSRSQLKIHRISAEFLKLWNGNSLQNTSTTLQNLNWCPDLTSICIIAVWNFSYLTRFQGKEDINNNEQTQMSKKHLRKFQEIADTLITAYPLIRMTPYLWIAISCKRNMRQQIICGRL